MNVHEKLVHSKQSCALNRLVGAVVVDQAA